MASSGSYPDPDSAQMGGSSAGLFVNQGGPMSPSQQQQQQVPTDPDLQLQENLAAHLSQSRMQSNGPPQDHQINPAMNAPHHQLQTPGRPTHSPQQMAQSVMSLEEHTPYGDYDAAQRKRSKVSRACDECRRKKIRCDATSENGPEACSSCKRTGARCQFSRQPMKRGPSKGYIKELADRLNTLESQMTSPHAPQQSGYDLPYLGDQNLTGLPDIQSPSQFQRKRTHSMSEGLQDPYGPSHRPNMGWQDASQRGIYALDDEFTVSHTDTPEGDQFSTNGNVQGSYRRMSQSYGDLALAGSLIQGSNEGVLKAYYTAIHPTLPLLPSDSGLLHRLINCPSKLREAFFLALEAAVRSYANSLLPPGDASVAQLIHRTLELVEQAQHALGDAEPNRQLYNRLVYCQILAFLAFTSDKSGPGAMTNSAELLGRVAGRISDIGVNDVKALNQIREQDGEAFQVSRRLFWCVFILDRFHASSMSKDLLLPLFCGTVSRDDFTALGETGYHLARVADIVGQISFLVRTSSIPNPDASSPASFSALTSTSPQSIYLNGQLSRFKESLDLSSLPPNSPPHLAYQYLRIMVARLSPLTPPTDLLAVTKDLLTNLVHAPSSPLNHIFASLVATSLTEITDRPEVSQEAQSAIQEMEEAIESGRIVHRSPDGPGWDAAIRDLLLQKNHPSSTTTTGNEPQPSSSSASAQPNMAGLQHLAAAAVGEREGADPSARPSSSSGNATRSDVKDDVAAAVKAASEAAAAQATAAAAQKLAQGGGSGGVFDSSVGVKEGFMNALLP